MTDLSRARWRTSSRSNGSGACVEVADNLPGVVVIRDSRDPGGPVLVVPQGGWARFVAAVRRPGFTRAAGTRPRRT